MDSRLVAKKKHGSESRLASHTLPPTSASSVFGYDGPAVRTSCDWSNRLWLPLQSELNEHQVEGGNSQNAKIMWMIRMAIVDQRMVLVMARETSRWLYFSWLPK